MYACKQGCYWGGGNDEYPLNNYAVIIFYFLQKGHITVCYSLKFLYKHAF